MKMERQSFTLQIRLYFKLGADAGDGDRAEVADFSAASAFAAAQRSSMTEYGLVVGGIMASSPDHIVHARSRLMLAVATVRVKS